MKKLQVFYEGWGERWPLATLADDGRHLLFEYSAEALEQGLELSPRHLALRASAFGGFPEHQMRLPGLVADALPDGWGLMLMDRLFRKAGRPSSGLSPLDRLAFIGTRAMGALTFEPADPLALSGEDVQLLELAQQAQAVIADKDTEALKALALMGGSPSFLSILWLIVHVGFCPALFKVPEQQCHRPECPSKSKCWAQIEKKKKDSASCEAKSLI